MKKNKKRLFIKNRFESMINKENIIKEFKSRGSYRIVVGTIPNRFCKEKDRVVIEAFYRRSGKEDFEVLYTPLTIQDSYDALFIDFCNILRRILNKANKVTKRWFLKEARDLDFFGIKLGEFLKPDSINFDWDKIDKNYLERNKSYDSI